MSAPTTVLVSTDLLERIAFDHGLTIELDRQCSYITYRGAVFYAPLAEVSA